ncbi:MAG TPA: hypothetical protein VI056_14445 [Candidatus Limnocylindria bacterium]
MKEQMQTPRNHEGEPPTHEPKETTQRLEQKADEQQGESNRARTEDKAREAREGRKANEGKVNTKGREVHFGG